MSDPILEKAGELKGNGNNLYVQGEYEKAVEEWNKGLQLVSKDKEKYMELYIAFLNNKSAGYLKLKRYGECIDHLKTVLDVDTKNWKAFMRMLQTYQMSEDFRSYLLCHKKWEKTFPEKASSEEVLKGLKYSKLGYLQQLKINVKEEQIIDVVPSENGDIIGLTVGFMGNNVYILNSQNEAAVIDCPSTIYGICEDFLKSKDNIHLLLTHAHLDHIFDYEDFLKMKNCKLYCHEEEQFWLNLGDEKTCEYMSKFLPIQGMNIKSIMTSPFILNMVGIPKPLKFENIKIDIPISDGQVLKVGKFKVNVIHTPGHSAGCVCFYLDEEGVVFTGDTLFVGNIGRYDLHGSDFSKLKESIQKKVYKLPNETVVFPGHPTGGTGAKFSSIGIQKMMNIIKSED